MIGVQPDTGDDRNARPIDACWRSIGIQGDRSCERLADHVHCRNCRIFREAAIQILDRHDVELLDAEAPASEAVTDEGERRSVLVFRIGEAWYGLATRRLVEVAPVTPIHSLPHQSAAAVLGVANVRGKLVACVSLSGLLEIDPKGRGASDRRVVPMMLVIDEDQGALAMPVDEVDRIHNIPVHRIVTADPDDDAAVIRFASGVVRWSDRSITLLDEEALMPAMVRSLA